MRRAAELLQEEAGADSMLFRPETSTSTSCHSDIYFPSFLFPTMLQPYTIMHEGSLCQLYPNIHLAIQACFHSVDHSHVQLFIDPGIQPAGFVGDQLQPVYEAYMTGTRRAAE